MIAGLSSWHEHHLVAAEAIADVTGLPNHVRLEAYSVLTRLPSGLALRPSDASGLLARRFPGAPLYVGRNEAALMIETLAAAGIVGGATYDGLVAMQASAHDELLLTLDRRAQDTYRRLGVLFRLISSGA